MKTTTRAPEPVPRPNPAPRPDSVPRLNSLLHRLRQTPGPEDEPYLDQLMLFLDNPPEGVGDRWKEGAAMCAAWGIATTHTSVYRLYRSYAIEWRAQAALQAESADAEKPEVLEKKAAEMIALRTCEFLADPRTAASTVVSLARLELARQRQLANLRGDTERALALLEWRVRNNWDGQFALGQLKKALQRTGAVKTGNFPIPPSVLDFFKDHM